MSLPLLVALVCLVWGGALAVAMSRLARRRRPDRLDDRIGPYRARPVAEEIEEWLRRQESPDAG